MDDYRNLDELYEVDEQYLNLDELDENYIILDEHKINIKGGA